MVGQDAPLQLDLAQAQRVLDAPETAGLRRHGWRDASEVASLLLLDSPAMAAWLSHEQTINSVERPVLEFYSPSAQAQPAGDRVVGNVAALFAARGGHDARFTRAEVRVAARDDLLAGFATRDLSRVQRAAANAPPGVVRRWAATILTDAALQNDAAGARAQALELYRSAVDAWPDDVTARINLAASLAGAGATLEAIQHAFRAVRLNPDPSRA